MAAPGPRPAHCCAHRDAHLSHAGDLGTRREDLGTGEDWHTVRTPWKPLQRPPWRRPGPSSRNGGGPPPASAGASQLISTQRTLGRARPHRSLTLEGPQGLDHNTQVPKASQVWGFITQLAAKPALNYVASPSHGG